MRCAKLTAHPFFFAMRIERRFAKYGHRFGVVPQGDFVATDQLVFLVGGDGQHDRYRLVDVFAKTVEVQGLPKKRGRLINATPTDDDTHPSLRVVPVNIPLRS